jgi:pimeloyl-ACP methyl ester carboxylesterase
MLTVQSPLRRCWPACAVLSAVAVGSAAAQDVAPWRDPSPHTTRRVTVEADVQVEVLEWGGTGRPLVLLAGAGHTAHVFDDFAQQLTKHGRVYGITRRGYGASSAPPSGYTASRIGTDVVQLLDALKLEHAVLIGHSLAGRELSFVASTHPERIAGVIYLDAAYRYAFEWPGSADNLLDLPPPPNPPPTIPQPSDRDLASFAAYRDWMTRVRGYTLPEAELHQLRVATATGGVGPSKTPDHIRKQFEAGGESFTPLDIPALAIFASPHALVSQSIRDAGPREVFEAFERFDEAMTERQASAFERGVAGSRVVRLRHASHYLFLSHGDAVLGEIETFLASLK